IIGFSDVIYSYRQPYLGGDGTANADTGVVQVVGNLEPEALVDNRHRLNHNTLGTSVQVSERDGARPGVVQDETGHGHTNTALDRVRQNIHLDSATEIVSGIPDRGALTIHIVEQVGHPLHEPVVTNTQAARESHGREIRLTRQLVRGGVITTLTVGDHININVPQTADAHEPHSAKPIGAGEMGFMSVSGLGNINIDVIPNRE